MPCESSFQLQGRCFLICLLGGVLGSGRFFSFFYFIAWLTGFLSLTASAFFNKCCTWSLAVFFDKCCTWSLAVSLGLLRQILAVSLLLVSSSKHAPSRMLASQSLDPKVDPRSALSLSWSRFNEHGYKLC